MLRFHIESFLFIHGRVESVLVENAVSEGHCGGKGRGNYLGPPAASTELHLTEYFSLG